MKIYTRQGDKGNTSLLGGIKVAKHHLRIEAYGTVDELNSYTGMVRDHIEDPEIHVLLGNIQNQLFNAGARLAARKEHAGKMKLPSVGDEEVMQLERAIDKMEKSLPELKSFILPGGDVAVSWCHIARSVCRRAERHAVALSESEIIDIPVITYLNRLSDFFFVLARKTAADKGKVDIPWKPD